VEVLDSDEEISGQLRIWGGAVGGGEARILGVTALDVGRELQRIRVDVGDQRTGIRYLLVEVRQEDGDRAWTAPVFVRPRAPVPASE